ncbi:FAD-dependent oxidoreductase [Neorhizobium galegae]|uniref:NAD(P)/FAD-dependent oxidoreductase n=1 Tax=Neorhizobium galegae TaxID=399 RepID=UPI0006225EC3|nr:FAD-dependent oxidoreductase [Neorhizobium galegae]MCQ1766740.1 FAD-dependent oxidoreductase [Neorhizobium galegae]MCQ1849457.1 FAD-dependent oxidoreductase [Neorhizobium galegae]CDZ30258.1 Rhodocoxin reductase [Neorhizobium galegae bv. officinalis]CDZ42683.1 Rhodocoxin reductase [Neorhizobium galegae bv. officinalis]
MAIVILGAGQAGLQIATSVRQKGYTGKVVLIGDEPHPPYQRPPLSKAFLKGTTDAASLIFRPAEALAAQGIDLILGQKARRIDLIAKTVEINDGTVSYEKLALALGARPRQLAVPGADLEGVYSLRGLADGQKLMSALTSANNVVIVGGGFIGLEVAATAVAAGKVVTVLEAGPRVMARAVAPQISTWFDKMHRDMGTRIVTSAVIAWIDGTDHVKTVTLGDGEVIAADLVLVGIGAVPNTEIAAEAGLECPNGVLVDAVGRTADSDIFAAGDCAFHPNRFAGSYVRLESVQNAIDQSKTVAAAMLDETASYDAVPWFWSDQGQAKLQTTGLPFAAERHVVRGDPEAGKFTVFHLKSGRVIAADSVNSPSDHMCARRMVAGGIPVIPEVLADPATDLKTLAMQRTA